MREEIPDLTTMSIASLAAEARALGIEVPTRHSRNWLKEQIAAKLAERQAVAYLPEATKAENVNLFA